MLNKFKVLALLALIGLNSSVQASHESVAQTSDQGSSIGLIISAIGICLVILNKVDVSKLSSKTADKLIAFLTGVVATKYTAVRTASFGIISEQWQGKVTQVEDMVKLLWTTAQKLCVLAIGLLISNKPVAPPVVTPALVVAPCVHCVHVEQPAVVPVNPEYVTL